MQLYFDIPHGALLGDTVAPQTIASATTVNGTGIDCQLIDGPLTCLINTGTFTNTDSAFTVKLQESDTSGGTYADFSPAAASTTYTITTGTSLAVAFKSNYRSKRWVRAVVTTTTTGSVSLPISVQLLGQLAIIGGNGTQL